MGLIATHNSGTGEKADGIISWLLTPFARTQSKTLKEQWLAGVRMFDIRFTDMGGRLVLCHGLWTSRKTLYNAIQDLSNLARDAEDETYIMLTYVPWGGDEDKIFPLLKYLPMENLKLMSVSVQREEWETRYSYDNMPGYVRKFKILDGRSLHTLIPIPWLWDKIYRQDKSGGEFNYEMFDFV